MTSNPLFNIQDVVNAASGVLLAQEMVTDAIADYRFMKSKVQDGKIVKLKCRIDGSEFEPFKIGFSNRAGYVTILTRDEQGWESKFYIPITKVTFAVVLEKPAKPEKEMGYAAIMKHVGEKMAEI